ncbi:Methionine--tRNA ligase [Bienertia sinuspersici]
MGDNLVLRFQYRGKDTDVVVNDVDKVNLLDLITEYWEICERENTPTPQNPGFTYLHKMKHVQVYTDIDLMNMFDNLCRRELIYNWVNDLAKPTAVVQAAQSLKAMGKTLQSNEPNTEPTRAHVENNSILLLMFKNNSNLLLLLKNNPNLLLLTTAKRKGLLAATISTKRTIDVYLAQDLKERNGLNLDSDHDYNPQLEETDVQVDSEDVSLDDEDDGMEEPKHQSMPLIHDYFDPYEGPFWEDDCEDIDNYMAKLYRNGELYKPVDFGHIALKPWQLFTDKMHLRNVVRDYRIQMKAQAFIEIHGGFDVSYSYLPNYCEGIEKACIDLWPNVGRRFCCKHLSVNFKNVFPGPKMWQLFWLAASATSPFTFGKAMKQIQKNKDAARIWLAKLGDQSGWSKHKFDTSLKCDVYITTFTESFNSTLGVDRSRTILTLLEGIRRVSIVRTATRREHCEKWERTNICPNIVKRVQFLCNESRTCLAYQSGPMEFEIVDGKSTLPVSLNNHTCICNAWQLSGIPCKHGMRATLYAGLDPHTYVHEWYSMKRYKMAYGSAINAIPDKDQWPETTFPAIEPPVLKRGHLSKAPTKKQKRINEQETPTTRTTTKGATQASTKRKKSNSTKARAAIYLLFLMFLFFGPGGSHLQLLNLTHPSMPLTTYLDVEDDAREWCDILEDKEKKKKREKGPVKPERTREDKGGLYRF